MYFYSLTIYYISNLITNMYCLWAKYFINKIYRHEKCVITITKYYNIILAHNTHPQSLSHTYTILLKY